MNKKHIYTIMGIALILSLLSFALLYVQNAFQKMQTNIIGQAVFPNFTDYEIQTIKIQKPSGRIITLRKNENNEWLVVNCFGYPAIPQKINAFLQELSSMKIVQNVYIDKSGLSELKLLSPKDKDKNSGSEIIISDDTDKVVFSIIVGVKRIDIFGDKQISRGRYIYKADMNRIFLVEYLLDEVNYRSKTWLNNKFVNIKDIKTVTLFKNNKEIWTIARPDINSKFVPAGKKADDEYNTENIDKIITSLENLKFETIANPSLTDAYTGLNNPYIVKVESFDNQSWHIYIGSQIKETKYVRVETDTAKNIKNISKPGTTKWIYLINQNRITPLIQSGKGLLKKDKKTPAPINKPYSSPIGSYEPFFGTL